MATLVQKLVYIFCLLVLSYSATFTFFKSSVEKKNCNSNLYISDDQTLLNKTKNVTYCTDNPAQYKLQKRCNYTVLYNYVLSSKRFRCQESITYATHSDYFHLDNLIPLLERWKGPVSIAVHASGSDFNSTLQSIFYFRNCVPLIKEYATFHLYFLKGHFPKQVRLY